MLALQQVETYTQALSHDYYYAYARISSTTSIPELHARKARRAQGKQSFQAQCHPKRQYDGNQYQT